MEFDKNKDIYLLSWARRLSAYPAVSAVKRRIHIEYELLACCFVG